jgi:hypothetical protein
MATRIKIARGRLAGARGEKEGPTFLAGGGPRSFDGDWRCGSFPGSASRGTSGKDHRASPHGRSLRRRTPLSLVEEASGGIRCPSHNRGNVRSLLTFFLVLLPSHPDRRLNIDHPRSDAGPRGRHGEIPKTARTEHAWAASTYSRTVIALT